MPRCQWPVRRLRPQLQVAVEVGQRLRDLAELEAARCRGGRRPRPASGRARGLVEVGDGLVVLAQRLVGHAAHEAGAGGASSSRPTALPARSSACRAWPHLEGRLRFPRQVVRGLGRGEQAHDKQRDQSHNRSPGGEHTSAKGAQLASTIPRAWAGASKRPPFRLPGARVECGGRR